VKPIVVPTARYLKQAKRLPSDAERIEMEDAIACFPEGHPVIPGAGGVRKARWGRGSKGKSGGVRAIYFFQCPVGRVFMLTLYSKGEKENLNASEKSDLRKVVEEIRGKFQ
jgi:hypothetical protein